MKDAKNILEKTECPSIDVLYNYVENKLSHKEKHQLEAHLNDCPFCNEALEGIASVDKDSFKKSIEVINKNIDEQTKKTISYQQFAVAASVVFLMFLGGLYVLNSSVDKNEQLSVTTSTEIKKDELAPIVLETREENEKGKKEEQEIIINNENNIIEKTDEIPSFKPNVVNVEDEIEIVELEMDVEPIVEKIDIEELEELPVEEIAIFEEEEEVEEYMEFAVDKERMDLNESSNVDKKTMISTNKVANGRSAAKGKYKTTVTNNSSIDYNHLLQIANNVIGKPSDEAEKDVDKYKSLSNQNNKVIRNQLDIIISGEYQKALDEINFLRMKDVWETEEDQTLEWLKIICELKLNRSAQESLKNLKKNKGPYQKEAKKLYNDLY